MIGRNAEAGHGYVQSVLSPYAPKFHCLSFLLPQLLTRIVGDPLLASNLIFIVFGMVTTALIGLLAATIFGTRVGLMAATLTAVAPVQTSLLAESISHSLFLPAFFGGLWLAWIAAQKAKPLLALASGLAIGVCWWARADGLLVAPVIAIFLLVGGALFSGLRRSIGLTVSYSVAFGAVYGLYAAFVNAVSGGISKAHGPLFDFLVYPPACEPTRDLNTYESFLELALAEPHCIIEKVVENAQIAPDVLFTWTGFPFVMLPLIGAAWVSESHWDRRTFGAHFILALAILPIAFYLPFHYAETRYVAPYAAVAFIWCACGLIALGERLKPVLGSFGYFLPSLAVTTLLLIITILHVPRLEALGGASYAEAGKWIDQNAGSRAVVWTSQSEVAYFSRRPWTYPPTPDDTEEWHRFSGEEVLLVVDELHFFDKNPPWMELLSRDSTQGLEALFTTKSQTHSVTIYRVRRGPALKSDVEPK